MSVIVRFAPSPTGYLHIGSARTALFNWLFARHHGGKMLLRIEDTDRARSTLEAVEAIYKGLEWLGIDWDETPVHQFERSERHVEVAHTLLEQGMAYRCYCSPEELEIMREEARAKNLPPVMMAGGEIAGLRRLPKVLSPLYALNPPKQGILLFMILSKGKYGFPINN